MNPVVVNASDKAISEAVRAELTTAEFVGMINRVIARSFREERLRGDRPVVSDREVRRRTEIAWKWFRIMRFDCGYTADRTADFLPVAVRKDLDGVAFEPPAKERSWSPDGLKTGG